MPRTGRGPDFYAGMRSHIESIPDTVREMHVAEPIREIPVTVLTPGKSTPLSQDQLERIGRLRAAGDRRKQRALDSSRRA